ncbi:hypothetical protein AD951_04725 [Acetobacter malorum]|uniref:Uncharacterized protein n=1 Tax=Acetobacter malorum TaxID=178901 RepID=A0A149UPM7_9PROT|nr:hypothetical protein [Acetobacter malorum]KXV69848.1 hypothetical protein AD951_04725 [Acetobacter malorum]
MVVETVDKTIADIVKYEIDRAVPRGWPVYVRFWNGKETNITTGYQHFEISPEFLICRGRQGHTHSYRLSNITEVWVMHDEKE